MMIGTASEFKMPMIFNLQTGGRTGAVAGPGPAGIFADVNDNESLPSAGYSFPDWPKYKQATVF